MFNRLFGALYWLCRCCAVGITAKLGFPEQKQYSKTLLRAVYFSESTNEISLQKQLASLEGIIELIPDPDIIFEFAHYRIHFQQL
jgi:hypothetical protein